MYITEEQLKTMADILSVSSGAIIEAREFARQLEMSHEYKEERLNKRISDLEAEVKERSDMCSSLSHLIKQQKEENAVIVNELTSRLKACENELENMEQIYKNVQELYRKELLLNDKLKQKIKQIKNPIKKRK